MLFSLIYFCCEKQESLKTPKKKKNVNLNAQKNGLERVGSSLAYAKAHRPSRASLVAVDAIGVRISRSQITSSMRPRSAGVANWPLSVRDAETMI